MDPEVRKRAEAAHVNLEWAPHDQIQPPRPVIKSEAERARSGVRSQGERLAQAQQWEVDLAVDRVDGKEGVGGERPILEDWATQDCRGTSPHLY